MVANWAPFPCSDNVRILSVKTKKARPPKRTGFGQLARLGMLLCRLFLAVYLGCARRFALVPFVGNVVPVEHAAGLVAGNAHCNGLRHACPHHVTDGCPAKIMENAAHVLQ